MSGLYGCRLPLGLVLVGTIYTFDKDTHYKTEICVVLTFAQSGNSAIPGCCPEGTLNFCPSTGAVCTDAVSTSHYTLVYKTVSTPASNTTQLSFSLNYIASPAATGVCSNQDIQLLQLFFEPSLAPYITGVGGSQGFRFL